MALPVLGQPPVDLALAPEPLAAEADKRRALLHPCGHIRPLVERLRTPMLLEGPTLVDVRRVTPVGGRIFASEGGQGEVVGRLVTARGEAVLAPVELQTVGCSSKRDALRIPLCVEGGSAQPDGWGVIAGELGGHRARLGRRRTGARLPAAGGLVDAAFGVTEDGLVGLALDQGSPQDDARQEHVLQRKARRQIDGGAEANEPLVDGRQDRAVQAGAVDVLEAEAGGTPAHGDAEGLGLGGGDVGLVLAVAVAGRDSQREQPRAIALGDQLRVGLGIDDGGDGAARRLVEGDREVRIREDDAARLVEDGGGLGMGAMRGQEHCEEGHAGEVGPEGVGGLPGNGDGEQQRQHGRTRRPPETSRLGQV